MQFRFRDNARELGAKRLSNVVKQAEIWLRRLKRANVGDVDAIQLVLNHTYGRVGKRKHELLLVQSSLTTLMIAIYVGNDAERESVDPR